MSAGWWLLGSLAAWGVFIGLLEGVHIPAWQTRNAYRWLVLGLLLVIAILTLKMLAFHAELTQLIPGCR